jgi:hypothetical protein
MKQSTGKPKLIQLSLKIAVMMVEKGLLTTGPTHVPNSLGMVHKPLLLIHMKLYMLEFTLIL